MKKFIHVIYICLLFLTSCHTDDERKNSATLSIEASYQMSGKFENDPKERMRNATLELMELSKKAFLDPDIAKEVGLIVKSNFYQDNVISIYDLLNPESSLAYKYGKLPSSIVGDFRNFYFKETKENGNIYPNLIYVAQQGVNLKSSKSTNNTNGDFYNQAQLMYYLPYDSNDNDVMFDTTGIPTLVPGVIDADGGLGVAYDGEDWEDVFSNDDTASNNYTLIINASFDNCSGLGFAPVPSLAIEENLPTECDNIAPMYGGAPSSGNPTTPANIYTGNCNDLKPGGSFIRQVFVGKAKLKKQYDHYISFTGNGGGSEIRYCRADSQQAIDIDSLGNYTSTQWDTRFSQYWSRKQIRKENVRVVSSLWDENWECFGTHEQLFVIYEEDDEGDLIIDQDLSFELADDTYAADIDVTIQNRSKDEALIIRKRERVEFFATNLLDQGGGCFDGSASFADRCWAIYDGGADISYTMYHRWVFVGNNSNF